MLIPGTPKTGGNSILIIQNQHLAQCLLPPYCTIHYGRSSAVLDLEQSYLRSPIAVILLLFVFVLENCCFIRNQLLERLCPRAELAICSVLLGLICSIKCSSISRSLLEKTNSSSQCDSSMSRTLVLSITLPGS